MAVSMWLAEATRSEMACWLSSMLASFCAALRMDTALSLAGTELKTS